jgi:hypothetical protein
MTDADVSVCRSRVVEAMKALAAIDAEPRLSLVHQARLSATRGKGALCAASVSATDVRPRRVGRVSRPTRGRVCRPGALQAFLDHVCRMVEKCGYVLTVGDQRLVFEVGHMEAIHCGWHRSDGRWPHLSA